MKEDGHLYTLQRDNVDRDVSETSPSILAAGSRGSLDEYIHSTGMQFLLHRQLLIPCEHNARASWYVFLRDCLRFPLIRLSSEVERARKLIETTCVGYKIAHVDTFEDKIVFTGGITHEDYVRFAISVPSLVADDRYKG